MKKIRENIEWNHVKHFALTYSCSFWSKYTVRTICRWCRIWGSVRWFSEKKIVGLNS